MKPLGWILVSLFALGLLMVLPLAALQRHRGPDCVGRIVTLERPDGTPLECVCADGVLSTCFNAGP
jgi:hypothetical protein